MHDGNHGMCGCMHHKAGPILIILIGIVFLLKALDVMAAATVDLAWPILFIVLGVIKMTGGSCKCCGPKM